MGLFNKKSVKKQEPPALPELPSLPEFPKLEKSPQEKNLNNQLPAFPNNSLGDKRGEEVLKANDFATSQERQKMQEPQDKIPVENKIQKPIVNEEREEIQEIPKQFVQAAKIVKKTEPIFIRLDKFEESLTLFEETKKKIIEIQKMLEEVKKIKEKEEKELDLWEKDIQNIKIKIEKIDKKIFSKIK